ncbi:monocarboxylate transporter 12-like [Anthonomus grandis grandis]|uniref:monocarboxylate transporter 12-like n=1 Tax=Anthonomus grandis grandis TaxID=2921223 RepID=UPI0021665DBB|nr:monocarboxylate transporter 12-like [Anthonomus grandis grandis]
MAAVTDEPSNQEDRSRPNLTRSRSLPQFSHHDSGLGSFYGGSGGEEVPGYKGTRFVADLRQLITLKQHYYPEGGWGWMVLWTAMTVHVLANGFTASVGVFQLEIVRKFGADFRKQTEWLGALATGISLLISPVVIAFCKKKSTRVTAVLGGLILALGCLFTSFATQFHQLMFSYGTVLGIGVGVTRDCAILMVAQYFKRRRELVEVFIVAGSGLGIVLMSLMVRSTISSLGWRLGLQTITGALSATFFLGMFYRSASLYHPQRRAILHIKNQKRKIRDKNRADDKNTFFDLSALKSVTVRILLVSTAITAFGINTPLFCLAYQAQVEGLDDWVIYVQIYLGLAWSLGCTIFSALVLHKTSECRIARQYLCQSAVFMCGLSVLAFTVVNDNYHAYVMFAWIYGFFYGGYHYSLKMYTYERVRARHFSRTWGFVQFSQAIPIAVGIPLSGYLNDEYGNRSGYYFSSVCTLVGSLTLFLTDFHRYRIAKHKHPRENGTRRACSNDACPHMRKLSFTQEPENEHGAYGHAGAAETAAFVLGGEAAAAAVQNGGRGDSGAAVSAADKGELTCISEEGIADMDLPDDLLDDLDYIGDCITSCNKVENYLMLSEFENNLFAEMPSILDRRGRRWSLAGFVHSKECEQHQELKNGRRKSGGRWNPKGINAVDESSV